MRRTLVLGLGNPLMGDDGVGVAALERLRQEWDVPGDVELVDGGTWGMNLLPLIESAERVILLDAIHTNVRPGTVMVLQRQDLPRYFSHKLSPHQIDLREVLALAELRGTLPNDVVAIGVEPESVEMRAGLSPSVAVAIGTMMARTVDHLEGLGHRCARREPAYA
jgi:hydrogenase maturation protease